MNEAPRDDDLYMFAAAALTGILSNPKRYARPSDMAKDAWLMAHKMMECPGRTAIIASPVDPNESIGDVFRRYFRDRT